MRILRWTVATRLRRMLLGALIILAIPVVVLGWYLFSPLFINKTVEEEFPLTISAEIPEDMSRSEVEGIMEGMAKVNGEMIEAMPDTEREALVISTGSFHDADGFHKGSGQATVYTLADDVLLLRFEDFRVTNGPDLHVLLSGHPDPGSQSQVKDDGYIDLGKLKGNIGNQNYEIPSGTDVSQYRSVVIYCKPFHVIFSAAPLS